MRCFRTTRYTVEIAEDLASICVDLPIYRSLNCEIRPEIVVRLRKTNHKGVLLQRQLVGCDSKRGYRKIDRKTGYLWAAERSGEITRYTGGRAGERASDWADVSQLSRATFGVVPGLDAVRTRAVVSI